MTHLIKKTKNRPLERLMFWMHQIDCIIYSIFILILLLHCIILEIIVIINLTVHVNKCKEFVMKDDIIF